MHSVAGYVEYLCPSESPLCSRMLTSLGVSGPLVLWLSPGVSQWGVPTRKQRKGVHSPSLLPVDLL